MQINNEKISGALWGLLIGDALGVPYEFHSPQEIPNSEHIDFVLPSGFARAHVGTPVGTWSDDGAQALCLLASLLFCQKFDSQDFGRRLLNWHDHGYMTPDGRVFDVGITTSEALRMLRQGKPALEAGSKQETANGNGALMRVLPLVLWHRGDDAELVELAELQSVVTHAHPRSQVCCSLYALWARYELTGRTWEEAVEFLYRHHHNNAAKIFELNQHVRPKEQLPAQGTGYVVDTLHSARAAVRMGYDYQTTVRAAIRFGNDTDTTACVAGGMAGLMYGKESIPEIWRERLRGQELVNELLQNLIA